MKYRKQLILLILLCLLGKGYAQNAIQSVHNQVGTRDYCYDNNIQTAKLYKEGNELAPPIISLQERVVLVFDDLSQDSRRFYYTISHCDANWKEDNLAHNEYSSGFPENALDNYRYSSNTKITYTNYTTTIPNDEFRVKVSGNYLIKIFDYDTRTLVLQKGFSVIEPIVRINANIRNVASLNQGSNQQLEFSIAYGSLPVIDPFMNFKVRIEQNSTQLPDISSPLPAFTEPALVTYTRPDKNIFPGNNEFRAFDTRQLSFGGVGVNSIQMVQGMYHVLLNEDKMNTSGRYLSTKDINGRYMINAERVTNSNTEADYTEVYFTLITQNPFLDDRVFLYGEFTNWNIDDRYEMKYNPEKNQYEASLLLKQGYYNYKYMVVHNDGTIDTHAVDGSFAETENTYDIFVYYSRPADRYERLVGFQRLNTRTVNQ